MTYDEFIVGMVDAVLKVLGTDDDDDVQKRASSMVQIVNAQVRAYTRGAGYIPDTLGNKWQPNADLETVVISATARWATNPAMSDSESETSPVFRQGVGGQVLLGEDGTVATQTFSFSGFQGFTELEKAILHQYRVRNG